jgi:hypothetical protein
VPWRQRSGPDAAQAAVWWSPRRDRVHSAVSASEFSHGQNEPRGAALPADPGPTNVPDRVLRAIDSPTIDHRGRISASSAPRSWKTSARIFQTAGPVVIYPASGTGAWEAALTNTLSPATPC